MAQILLEVRDKLRLTPLHKFPPSPLLCSNVVLQITFYEPVFKPKQHWTVVGVVNNLFLFVDAELL